MIAGRLQYRLKVYEPVRTQAQDGSETTEWRLTGTIRAERVKMSGSLTIEAGELFPDYRTDWNIRAAHRVGEHWRVEQPGGQLYEVTNIIPNLRRGMKTLQTARVNE